MCVSIAKRCAALLLDEHDDTLGLPGRRVVHGIFLVANPSIAALLVAIEERHGPLGVRLDAILAAGHRAQGNKRPGVGVVKLRRLLLAMRINQENTLWTQVDTTSAKQSVLLIYVQVSIIPSACQILDQD